MRGYWLHNVFCNMPSDTGRLIKHLTGRLTRLQRTECTIICIICISAIIIILVRFYIALSHVTYCAQSALQLPFPGNDHFTIIIPDVSNIGTTDQSTFSTPRGAYNPCCHLWCKGLRVTVIPGPQLYSWVD